MYELRDTDNPLADLWGIYSLIGTRDKPKRLIGLRASPITVSFSGRSQVELQAQRWPAISAIWLPAPGPQ